MNKEILAAAFMLVVVILAILVIAKPPAPPTEPTTYQFACLDSAGQPAVLSPKLKSYWYTANSVRGEDDKGTQYFYTPPQGWLCIISEVK